MFVGNTRNWQFKPFNSDILCIIMAFIWSKNRCDASTFVKLVHWAKMYFQRNEFEPLFSMSLNQFMNNLVCALRISIYQNTLINFVVFATAKIEFPFPCPFAANCTTFMRNGENDSLIIDRLFWVPPAKPKINCYWWKLCTQSMFAMFGFIVWSKHGAEIERGQSVLKSTAKYAQIDTRYSLQ